MKEQRNKEIDDARNALLLLATIVVAPKLPDMVVDVLAGTAIAAWVFVRPSVFDAGERLWRFITRA